VGGPDNAELPAGEIGEVLVPRGYFAGYRNKEAENAKTLAGGVLHCGDLAVADADGCLKVLGRTSELQSSRERGLFLRELEDSLYEHPAVKHAAVVEAAGSGELLAFVELLDGARPADGELDGLVADRVSAGHGDVSATVLEAMPRTFSGKVDRRALALPVPA
jgi:acyl-coenzyme A synthetase/AMP-(fatty) acid ligase